MRRLLLVGVWIGLVVVVSPAAADPPQVRFGMTFGINRNIPEAHEFGPMVGVGTSAGRFTGEVNYTYLSMFDDVARVHRVGVALRMDLVRSWSLDGDSKAWYGEVGAARRFGFWSPDDFAPAVDKSQDELQLATGYELSGNGGAWQLGLRFGFAKRDPMLGAACRGTGCAIAMPASTGIAESVLLEWTWLLGRRY